MKWLIITISYIFIINDIITKYLFFNKTNDNSLTVIKLKGN